MGLMTGLMTDDQRPVTQYSRRARCGRDAVRARSVTGAGHEGTCIAVVLAGREFPVIGRWSSVIRRDPRACMCNGTQLHAWIRCDQLRSTVAALADAGLPAAPRLAARSRA